MTRKLLAEGERIMTYAEISAQGISIDLPPVAPGLAAGIIGGELLRYRAGSTSA